MVNWARFQGLNLRRLFPFFLLSLLERANFLDILSVVILDIEMSVYVRGIK